MNCDPFHSLFLLLTISLKQLFRSALQNFAKVKKRLVMEFFSESHRLQLIKKGLHQRFFPETFVNFFRKILSRTTFSECFCFGDWPCATLSKQKVFDLAH